MSGKYKLSSSLADLFVDQFFRMIHFIKTKIQRTKNRCGSEERKNSTKSDHITQSLTLGMLLNDEEDFLDHGNTQEKHYT